jgi:hypothetical protein
MKLRPGWIVAIAALVGIGAIARYLAARVRDLSGQWQGTLQTAEGLRNVLKIARSENGGWTAKLYSIDQAPEPIPMSSILFCGSELRFSVDAVQGSYLGKLTPDGQSIAGAWTQRGKVSPLDLYRATAETAWPTDGPPERGGTLPVAESPPEPEEPPTISATVEEPAALTPQPHGNCAVAASPEAPPKPQQREPDRTVDSRARTYWENLEAATVEPADVTTELAAYWTPALLKQASERRHSLGRLDRFTFRGTRAAKGITFYNYTLRFKSGAVYEWSVQITSEGKIAGTSPLRENR